MKLQDIENVVEKQKMKNGETVVLSYDECDQNFNEIVGDCYSGFYLVEGKSSLQQWINRHVPQDTQEQREEIVEKIFLRNNCTEDFIKEMSTWLKNKNFLALPLYIHEHSGVTYSVNPIPLGNQFDGGCIPGGFIILDKVKVRHLFGIKKLTTKKVEKEVKAFVQDYMSWANGSIYSSYLINEVDDVIDEIHGMLDNGQSESEQLESIISNYFEVDCALAS
ncbi:hypothetical protein [Lactococcus petauri]|uniref:Uncharacterized protein n=1 Tax=Lactococcus petauri TaxID=1940789 RepID=A0A252CF74_9LACT|nr:hypothetical protein [Lactococcus petauri]OUK05201.1 hypothetical protein BZZ03_00340 [Lactococcus petauri]